MVLVIGKSGQLSDSLARLLGSQCLQIGRPEMDLAHPENLRKQLDLLAPTLIINAAAYTAVDQAEQDYELALAVNAKAPKVMAEYCLAHQIPFVHYSTDYVFSGEGDTPWKEECLARPINAYGRSKWEGEKAIIETGGMYLIFRTSWVYEAHGKNFMETMIRRGLEDTLIKVVNDQMGAPTRARELAAATIEILNKLSKSSPFPAGTYHMVNSGFTSWYGFARKIFELGSEMGLPLDIHNITPVSSIEFPRPAQRPMNSKLSTLKLKEIFCMTLPPWEESLKACLLDRIK